MTILSTSATAAAAAGIAARAGLAIAAGLVAAHRLMASSRTAEAPAAAHMMWSRSSGSRTMPTVASGKAATRLRFHSAMTTACSAAIPVTLAGRLAEPGGGPLLPDPPRPKCMGE